MPPYTFASLNAGDSFTFTLGGPRFVKLGPSTYRTAGGVHPTTCADPGRYVHEVHPKIHSTHASNLSGTRYAQRMTTEKATVSSATGVERMRMIAALLATLDALNEGDPNAARRAVIAELQRLGVIRGA